MDDAQLRQSQIAFGGFAGVKKTERWKYPQTVGQDTYTDNINFNSHDSSEYAIKRMDHVSQATSEPFMLFEFMTIDQDILDARNSAASTSISNFYNRIRGLDDEERRRQGQINNSTNPAAIAAGSIMESKDFVKNWIKESMEPAPRNYTGSVALYMPTDIQINDSMVYNEDTRKLGANIEGLIDGNVDLVNLTTLTDPAVLATIGAGAGALPFVPGGAAINAVLAGSLGQIAQTEVQRHLGQVMNPNELARYSQTALRTFTFNWIILPDNEYESDQAAGLIKFFRKSAHAKRTNATVVSVPDHVITSFHGAKDMIQLPPCFIESVNVTYNPNNSSFFKRNNAPVEIGLSITMKEIVPIYAQDVERGL